MTDPIHVRQWPDSTYPATCKACGKDIPLSQPRGKDINSRDTWCKPCLDANASSFQVELGEASKKRPSFVPSSSSSNSSSSGRDNPRRLGQCCICGAEADIAWESANGEERLFCGACQMLRTKVYRLKKMGVWPFVNEGKISTKEAK